jgi:hypothetical protein
VRTVRLVPYAGRRVVTGGQGYVGGALDAPGARERFTERLLAAGFALDGLGALEGPGEGTPR